MSLNNKSYYHNLQIQVKIVNLFEKEQLNPDFVKINPQHCVPTLVDNDFVLWESRAIATYLVDSRAPGNSLYPEDLKKRARIDQRLYFDLGTLYARLRAICVSFSSIKKSHPSTINQINRFHLVPHNLPGRNDNSRR